MAERILVAGDTHGDTGHLVYLIQQARQHGVRKIMQLGDFGAWEHTADGREFFDTGNKVAEREGVTVYWLDGNHDKSSLVLELYGQQPDEEGFLLCRPNIRYAPRGHRWQWGESRCMAFGGAYSVDKGWRIEEERRNTTKAAVRAARYGATPRDFTGTLWFPEEEATDAQVDAALANPAPVDVLFTHDKPRAAAVGWNRKDLPECWPNQDRVQRLVRALRPALVLHGHLHYPYETGIYNGEGTNPWVTVRGLDCGQGGYHPGYRVRDSWEILEL